MGRHFQHQPAASVQLLRDPQQHCKGAQLSREAPGYKAMNSPAKEQSHPYLGNGAEAGGATGSCLAGRPAAATPGSLGRSGLAGRSQWHSLSGPITSRLMVTRHLVFCNEEEVREAAPSFAFSSSLLRFTPWDTDAKPPSGQVQSVSSRAEKAASGSGASERLLKASRRADSPWKAGRPGRHLQGKGAAAGHVTGCTERWSLGQVSVRRHEAPEEQQQKASSGGRRSASQSPPSGRAEGPVTASLNCGQAGAQRSLGGWASSARSAPDPGDGVSAPSGPHPATAV